MAENQNGVLDKDESRYNGEDVGKVIHPAASYVVPSDNRYAGYGEAIFSDVPEYTTPMDCTIIGSMPTWLKGSFIRVGPGRYKWGETEAKHFFDGDSIAHRFNINYGKVMYQSKYLQTEFHRKNEKYNRISASGFATWAPPDPCANIFRRLAMYVIPGMLSDNPGVNIFNIQGKAYSTTESPWMVEIDKNTLDTIKIINGRNQLSSTTGTWLAHPHFEPDGSIWIFSTMHANACYELIKIPPTPGPIPLDGIEVFKTIQCGQHGAGYYHSFASTENYIILVVNPLFLDGLCSLLTMNIRQKPISEILTFKPEYGNSFRIIDKKTKEELRECTAAPFFVFHHANAYETETEIIIDLCAYKDDEVIRHLYLKNGYNNFAGLTIDPPNLQRYRIPKTVIMQNDPEPYQFPIISREGKDYEILAPSIEGPVINYHMVNGKDYKYIWGISDFIFTQRLVKVNVKTKECLYWNAPINTVSSMPFFVAKPGGTDEDDGVLVTNCTGANGEDSFFVVLDGKTMEEICRANMPVLINLGMHGSFFFDK